MTTPEERRAQILANATRRQQQAAATAQPVTAPVHNPAPAVAAPAPAAAAQGPRAPRATSTNKEVQVNVVPKGTKPAQAARQNPGGTARQIGAQGARTGSRTNRNVQQGRPAQGNVVRPGTSSTSVQRVPSAGQRAQAGTAPAAATSPAAQRVAPVQMQSNAPVADLSIVLAYHARATLVTPQLRAIAASSVRPVGMVAWVNPSEIGQFPAHVLRDLEQVAPIYPTADMGPWMRWAIAGQCATKYVAVLDDDCLPGPKWFQAAIERLDVAGESDVVVAAGAIYNSDNPSDMQLLGPEQIPQTEQGPDIGRGGWIMRSHVARQIANTMRYSEILSTGIHVASVVQSMDGSHILLPYSADRTTYGMLEAPRTENSISTRLAAIASVDPEVQTPEAIREIAYYAYRDDGWMPLVVASSEETVRTIIDPGTSP